MRTKVQFIHIKARLSTRTLTWLMSHWKYALLATLAAFIFMELMYWMFNLGVLTTILMSTQVDLSDKLAVLASPLQSIALASGMTTVVLMVILSIVQGISIATLAYIIRRQRTIDANLIGGSSLISLLALLGLGCPACGTSLITPVVALFASSSAVAISEQIMVVVLPLALAIGIYGLYEMGVKAANIRVAAEGIPD